MANDVTIGASLQVDAGNTAPTIKEVREQIKQFKAELDNATVGSEQHKAALQKLKVANEQLNPTFKEQGNALSQIKDHLSGSFPAFGKAAEGAKSFGATLKALMMNPLILTITLIVAGLKFLYEAFTYTAGGAKFVGQVMAGVEAVFKTVIDRVMHFAGAMAKLFAGDFKGAWAEAKATVTGFGDAVVNSFQKAADAKRLLQEVNKELRELGVERAKANKELAELKEDIYDEDKSFKDRKDALAKVRTNEELLDQKEIATLKKKIDAKKQEAAVSALSYEARKAADDEEAQLEIELANKQQEQSTKRRQADKVGRQLDKQENAKQREEEKEARDKAKEARDKARELEKAEKERHRAYTEQLEKLQQENALALIRDAYAKRLQEQKYASQKEIALIEQNFKEGKLKRSEFNTLIAQQTIANNNRIQQINDEHDKEVALKQKEKDDAAKKKLQEDLAKERELGQKEIALKIAMSKKKYDLQRQELDYKQQLIEEQYKKELAAAQGNALRIREVELKHNEDYFQLSEARKAISKAEKDAKLADEDAVGNALTAISDVIGKQTAVGKGLSIAAALINTYTGITKALAQGGIAGIAGAIGVGAIGFKSVQSIINTKIPGVGTSSNGAVTGSLSSTAPLQPKATQQSTTLDQASIQAIGNATNRAFVLEADIANNRERVERLNRAARIG
jgi:hypothetical protein